MIVFSNPGTLDVRCLTTMGINVKPDEATAIGEFGTGLKVAIAVLLRTGHEIEIYSGNEKHTFLTKTDKVRGKEFNFITMFTERYLEDQVAETQLGFTTDLGKHWAIWMAYRELYSNAVDEKGSVSQTDEQGIAWFTESGTKDNDRTLIVVSGPDIDTIHAERSKYFLTTWPMWENDTIAIHAAQGNSVFYHGILAGQFEPAPAFAYNLKIKVQLTEDRTFNNIYTAKHLVAQALLKCDDEALLIKAFENSFERALDFNWSGHDLGSTIEALAMKRIRAKQSIPSSLRDKLRSVKGADFDKETLVVPTNAADMLLCAPEITPSTSSRSSIFSGIYDLEDQIQQLTAQNAYWRACVEKLAGAAEGPTSIASEDAVQEPREIHVEGPLSDNEPF